MNIMKKATATIITLSALLAGPASAIVTNDDPIQLLQDALAPSERASETILDDSLTLEGYLADSSERDFQEAFVDTDVSKELKFEFLFN